MESAGNAPRHIGDVLREHNIRLETNDPVARGGFTQVPNFILDDPSLSLGAKVTYAKFLEYAWHHNSCFPGQERLANEIGMSRPRVNEFVKELERVGLVTIKRRGQGKTNLYVIKFVVQKKRRTVDKKG